MENGCSRAIEILPSVETGPVTDVNIFEISEETVIEQTNLIKHAAAVKCSSCTGREYLGGMQITGSITHASAAYSVTTDGIPVSGAVDAGWSPGTEHTAADGEDRSGFPDSGMMDIFG